MAVRHIDKIEVLIQPTAFGDGVDGSESYVDAIDVRFLDKTVLEASINPVITPGEVVTIFKSVIAAAHPNADLSLVMPRREYLGMTDLRAYFNYYTPPELTASIRGWMREQQASLAAIVESIVIPADLVASIRGWAQGTTNLTAFGGGHLPASLISSILGYPPVDLPAQILANRTNDVTASIFGVGPVGLLASIRGTYFETITASIIGWALTDLSASIIGALPTNLAATVRGVVFRNLLAAVRAQRASTNDISAYIAGFLYTEVTQSLLASIKGVYTDYTSLPASIRGWVEATANLSAYGGGHLPADLSGFSKAYFRGPSDVGASITGGYADETEPWGDIYIRDVQAYVGISSAFSALSAIIGAVQSYSLASSIIGWAISDLVASAVASGGFSNLSAQISTSSMFVNLAATITPKVMWILSAIPVNTLNVYDLSATITSILCGVTSGYANLTSSVRATYYASLTAYICNNPIEANLRAQVGNNVRKIDKLEVGFYPTVDCNTTGTSKLVDAVTVSFEAGWKAVLQASIVGTLQYSTLAASISPVLPVLRALKGVSTIPWVDISNPSNTKTVELLFSDGETEYYYFSEAGEAVKDDFQTDWKLDVAAYSEIAGFKDKQYARHKSVNIIGPYGSLDAAIKDAIRLATEGDIQSLTALITAIGYAENLTASIVPWPADKAGDLAAYIVGQL